MGKNILVLNLTRMGDLIQTSPMIPALKEMEPDCKITMLVNDKFAQIVQFMDGVDHTIPFEIHRFAVDDGGDADVVALYEYLDEFTLEMKKKDFDIILNLSHTKLSAMLAKMIGAPDIRGFLSTDRGERLIRDPWLVYFSTFLNFRKLNRFNLVDIYARGAGIPIGKKLNLNLGQSGGAHESVMEKMNALSISAGDPLIGIQAGASRVDRRWPPARFASVADRLAEEKGAKIVLFGASSEKKLGDEVETAMNEKCINLIGQTSLEELVEWVSRLDLLITNDTGTMHIATALSRPVLALFFVHARTEETGPYCEGAVILQADIDCAPCTHHTKCSHHSCLTYTTADDAYLAAVSILDLTPLAEIDDGIFALTKVFVSCKGEDGGIDYSPIKREPLNIEDFFAYLYRPIFNEALRRWESPEAMELSGNISHGAIRVILKSFDAPTEKQYLGWINRAVEGASRLEELATRGVAVTNDIVNSDEGSLERTLTNAAPLLASMDREIGALAGSYEMVAPLALVYRRRAENFEGSNPKDLAREANLAHSWLRSACKLFKNCASLALVEFDNKWRD
jgi:lipopolysaccharide heptosyltransferase II